MLALVASATPGAAPDRTPHTFVVPATAEGQAALERSGARVVARYESFTVAEAAGDSAARLRAAGADQRDDFSTVRLRGRAVDPRAARARLGGKGGADAGRLASGRPGLALVQFVGPVKDAWRARLEDTGVRIVTYMAQNAYLVYGNGPALARVARLQDSDPAVRAVTPFEAGDKLGGGVARSGKARLAIQTLSGDAGDGARRTIAAAGVQLRPASAVGPYRTQFTLVDAGVARRLADDPGVLSVLPYREPRLRDERAAQIVAANLTGNVPTGPGYLSWLASEGFPATTFDFAVDLTDEGLDKGVLPPAAGSHPDFYEAGSSSNPTRIVYQSNWTHDTDARDCGGHGTNVASISTGYNDQAGTSNTTNDSAGFNYGQGIAPFAKLGASKIFRCTNGVFDVIGTLTDLTSSAYANGARISSNSWGADTFGDYDSDSQEYDALVRDARPTVGGNQEMVEVFAAGNAGPGTGTVGSPGNAKNVIAVGASENVRAIGGSDGCAVPDSGANDARDLIDFSSRGPTADGRLKPEVVAPGTHVSGASPQVGASYNGSGTCNPEFPSGNTLYSLVSGTSQATPEVSGAAALVRDWYRRTVGGTVTPPSPAMTKAILVNTASDQAGGQDGAGGVNANVPNDDQGWGRVNMGTVLDGTARFYRDQADVLAASGDSVTRTFAAPNAAKPFKVTLAWTDPPGPTTGNAFVNDLDLVVNAGGQTYKGNVLAGGFSVAGGTADPRNNVESVYLPAGVTGTVSVMVRGTNIAGDGVPGNGDATDQDFALVVSNATEQPNAPVLGHDLTTVDDTAGGDGDGAVDPGESIALDERVRNFGSGAATAINGVLSASTGGVSVSQPNSGYPTIAAGATGTNTAHFGADVSAGVSCGATLDFTLQLTTAQGSFSIPIKVPTGAPGAPVSRNSSDVPKTIPDLGTAQSTLSVATPGFVKDVNVRIGSIQHTADGDLRISLIGPDSTTVVLSDRNGGLGNNYTNTVFDDAAATAIAAGAPPYTGSFRPEAELAAFNDKQQQGTWTLRVEDLLAVDSGTLQAWGTDTRIAECTTPDTQPPDTTINSGPTGPTNDSTPTFSFSSSEPNSTFECRTDAAAFGSCTSPFTTATLAEGPHTFQVRATDAASNVDPTPASQTFTVDTIAPDTAIDSGPAGPTNDSTPSFTFSSADGTATFECRIGAAAFAACSSPFTSSALADGARTFDVRAKDPAGNVDPTPASRSFTVDTVAPAVTLTSPASGFTNDSTPTLSGAAGAASGDAATVTVNVYLGTTPTGSPVQVHSVPVSSAAWTKDASPALADGVYTARAEQTDNAGNTGTSAARTFTVDTVAPDTSIASGPSGVTNDSTPTFGYSSNDAAATFKCRVDTDSFTACGASFTPAAPLMDGPHTFEVEATDQAGNTDATPASRSFTVNAQAPDTTITSGPSGTTSQTMPTFEFSSPEPGAHFECSLDSGPFTACTSPRTVGPLADGSHTFAVRAIDANGNTDPTPASRAFTINPVTAPAAGATPPAGSSQPAPPASTVTTLDTTAPALRILTRTASLRRGRVTIRLVCPASEPGGCLGTLVLKSGATTLGKRTFRIAGGRRAGFAIALRRAGLRLLATRTSLRVAVTARTRDTAGNRSTTRRRVVIRG